jgi:hypothetical protein
MLSLPESLVDESTLTRRQLEALQSYMRVALGEIRYREAAAIGPSKKVTVGSYFRTVGQARTNVRRSIATLLIGLWLGIVKPEDVRRLLETAGGNVVDLPEEEKERFVAVLRVLLERIVM